MIVTTGETIPYYFVSEILDVVTGNAVQSKHVGRDILAGLKSLVGGEIGGYTELMNDARKTAYERLVQAADELGADAIICMRYATSMIGAGMSEVLAFGTAVKIIRQ